MNISAKLSSSNIENNIDSITPKNANYDFKSHAYHQPILYHKLCCNSDIDLVHSHSAEVVHKIVVF